MSAAIAGATRETDLIGWYEEGRILAVIFAELNVEENAPVAELLRSKIETGSENPLAAKAAAKIVITTHIFPESWNQDGTERPADHEALSGSVGEGFKEAAAHRRKARNRCSRQRASSVDTFSRFWPRSLLLSSLRRKGR